MKSNTNDNQQESATINYLVLTCVLTVIFPTPSQTIARTTASCGTTVAGIKHFSTRAHGLVPTQGKPNKQNYLL